MKHDLSQNQRYDAYLQDPSNTGTRSCSEHTGVGNDQHHRPASLRPALQMPQGSALESPSGQEEHNLINRLPRIVPTCSARIFTPRPICEYNTRGLFCR